MYVKTLLIPNYESAKAFVNITSKYSDIKITLEHDGMVIDAHSILGVMSIDKNLPVTLKAEGDGCEQFIEEIEEYAAAV